MIKEKYKNVVIIGVCLVVCYYCYQLKDCCFVETGYSLYEGNQNTGIRPYTLVVD